MNKELLIREFIEVATLGNGKDFEKLAEYFGKANITNKEDDYFDTNYKHLVVTFNKGKDNKAMISTCFESYTEDGGMEMVWDLTCKEQGGKEVKKVKINNPFDKKFFVKDASDWGESVESYYANTNENYVVIISGHLLLWDDGANPVIYGSKGDALAELNEDDDLREVNIITEKELIDTYCKEELEEELTISRGVMGSKGHDAELVRKMNVLYNDSKEDEVLLNMFWIAITAHYRRDLHTIIGSGEFDSLFAGLKTDEEILNELLGNWERYLYGYLTNIASDKDLEVILKFCGMNSNH